MSYLAETIEALMSERGITKAIEVVRASGVDESAFSRWRNGLQTTISDEDLEKLARGLSPKTEDHARLVAARMRDVCHGPGAELVSVSIEERTLREDPHPYGSKKLSPTGRKTFDTLAAEYSHDGDLRDVLDGLANIIREKNVAGKSALAGERPSPGKR